MQQNYLQLIIQILFVKLHGFCQFTHWNIGFCRKSIGLKDFAKLRAGALAHGQKQWLEIGMQLVQKPEIIMLDEPAAGMGKPETFKTGEILKEIKKDCTVIVIEHDMEFVKQTADVVTFLHEGKVLMEGDIDSVLADKTVQSVYLGRGGEPEM
mgnify:CR=1 FL=1